MTLVNEQRFMEEEMKSLEDEKQSLEEKINLLEEKVQHLEEENRFLKKDINEAVEEIRKMEKLNTKKSSWRQTRGRMYGWVSDYCLKKKADLLQ